ncbi:hypothetical protein FRB95_009732 [Tulasnella sp. JGI-2019a]|nr:hypothetical protein FRB93_001763 [Tulasnella sp. JGI-2019a]KAG9036158.1 hypothetical protein FRB95_009732 [Tulasnella sp. JGI-2019a]
MRTTTPNEQQMYDALEPDQRRRVDAIRAQRADNERRQALQSMNPDTEKPVWADNTKRPS